MNSKIDSIFKFLKENRKYNRNLQNKVRAEWLSQAKGNKKEMAFILLHKTFNTQRTPKLDNAQKFFEKISNERNVLRSFSSFCTYLLGDHFDESTPYLSLYKGLEKEHGWGPKTSALFVRNVYQIHQLNKDGEFRFWDDTPRLLKPDELYVPVDAVIKDIFHRFDPSLKDFNSINEFLKEWKPTEVWDDLWYWGFITQKGKEGSRKLGFNKGKYWSLLHADKNPKKIQEIERKCKEFIALLPKSKSSGG